MIPLADDGSGAGTPADMAARLRSTLPAGWFPVSPPAPISSATPVLDGLLAGLGSAWSFCFDLLSFSAAQTRLKTSFGAFLDMISEDLFGSNLPRRTDETDDRFRARISVSLISRRGTRQAVCDAVVAITSAVPSVYELMRGLDCGGYASLGAEGKGGGRGYGSTGLRFGSDILPFQYLLEVQAYSSFAPGLLSGREGPATFLNKNGLIELAGARVLRPDYQQGEVVGALLEPRGFNLIIDSRFWTGFAQAKVSGDTDASWQVDASKPGLFGTDPLLAVTAATGTGLVGPSIDVAVAGSAVTGSAWILLPGGSSMIEVELVLTDLSVGEAARVSADMTRPGQWQRLIVSTQPQSASGRNLRMGLIISSSGGDASSLSTQCWQLEPGNTATSYIPTAGTFGIRAQDDVVSSEPAGPLVDFSVSDVLDAVALSIPAATIAWTAVALPYAAG